MTDSVHILIVDDHDLVLKGMQAVLQKSFPKALVTASRNGAQARDTVLHDVVDLAVLDLELPDISGFDLIDFIHRTSPGTGIVVNTVHEEIWLLRKLRNYAVDGLVFKSVDSSALVRTVKCVIDGERIGEVVPECGSPLTEKELEVLRLIASGNDSQEIAEKLFISVNTVESHRRHIMRKLEASNVADMVMRAVSAGLIPPLRLG